jgi:hypothetical protein
LGGDQDGDHYADLSPRCKSKADERILYCDKWKFMSMSLPSHWKGSKALIHWLCG